MLTCAHQAPPSEESICFCASKGWDWVCEDLILSAWQDLDSPWKHFSGFIHERIIKMVWLKDSTWMWLAPFLLRMNKERVRPGRHNYSSVLASWLWAPCDQLTHVFPWWKVSPICEAKMNLSLLKLLSSNVLLQQWEKSLTLRHWHVGL